MAINLWLKCKNNSGVTQPNFYNPLPLGWNNHIYGLPNGDYIISFYASSASSSQLRVVGQSSIGIDQRITLTPNRTFYSFKFNTVSQPGYLVAFNDTASIGDIIIDSITFVQAPRPKLTINGVDGFKSGKWTLHANTTVQDDQTIVLNATNVGSQQNQSDFISILPNQPVTCSATIVGNGYGYLRFYDSNKVQLQVTGSFTTTSTFTSPSNASYIKLYLETIATSGQITYSKPMVNLGSTAVPYEPKRGDKMCLPVAKKNLVFDLSQFDNNTSSSGGNCSYFNVTSNEIKLTPTSTWAGYYAIIAGTSSGNNGYYPIAPLQGKSVTVSFTVGDLTNIGAGTAEVSIPTHHPTGSEVYAGSLSLSDSMKGTRQSFVASVPADATYINLTVRSAGGTLPSYIHIKDIQIELGTTATPYTPYAVQTSKLPKRYVPKKNLFYIADPRLSDCATRSVLPGLTDVAGINGFVHGIHFADNLNTYYAYQSFTLLTNQNYTFSVFLKMDDNSLPVSTGNISSADFSLVINGGAFNATSITSIGNGIYRVSATTSTPSPIINGNVGVVKYNTQSSKGFTISGWQLEQNSNLTPFEPFTPLLPKANTGLSLNGVSDYITTSYGLGLNMTGYTINCDLIINQIAANGEVFFGAGYDTGNNNKRFYVGIAGGNNSVSLGVDTLTWSNSSFTVSPGQEINIQITFTNGNANLYINGSFIQSKPYNGFGLFDNFMLGRYQGSYYAPVTIKSFSVIDSNGITKLNYDFTNPKNIVGSTFVPNAQNLVPSFEDSRWSINANAKVMGKDVLHLDPTGAWQSSTINLPISNGTYRFALTTNSAYQNAWVYKGTDTLMQSPMAYIPSSTFTVDSSYGGSIIVRLSDPSSNPTTPIDFIRPQLCQLNGTEGTINGSPIQKQRMIKRTFYAKR